MFLLHSKHPIGVLDGISFGAFLRGAEEQGFTFPCLRRAYPIIAIGTWLPRDDQQVLEKNPVHNKRVQFSTFL
jgi:hypothetical protein